MISVVVISEPVDIDFDTPHLEVALLRAIIVLVVDYRIEDDLGGGAAAVHEYIEEAAVGERDDAGFLADDEGGIFEKEVDIFNINAGGSGVAGIKGVVVCELRFGESFKKCAIWDKMFCGKIVS